MNKIDKVFRELEQLYDFQKELSKFRLQKRNETSKGMPRKNNPVTAYPIQD